MTVEPTLFDTDPLQGELGTAVGLWRLLQVRGVGPKAALGLARTFDTWNGLDSNLARAVEIAGRSSVEDLAEAVASPLSPPILDTGTRLVGFFDGDFPDLLRSIPQPPAVLWCRGTVPAGQLAAVVGTRSPTATGQLAASEAASALVAGGYGVVSGLARGIDAAAHEAAIESHGVTWAYLGSGVDRPSPAENRPLAERIVESGGGLLSEQPPGTEPSAHTLVARDRLQSGSCGLTFIVQTGIPSGTLHTARFTIEQGRRLCVLAPPSGEGDRPEWAGNAALVDPAGCDPGVLRAMGRLAEKIALRRPVADVSISSVDELLAALG